MNRGVSILNINIKYKPPTYSLYWLWQLLIMQIFSILLLLQPTSKYSLISTKVSNTLKSSSLSEKDQGSCRSKTTREISFINKLYWNNPSITIKFLLFSEYSIHYNMFQPTWLSSGDTQYVQNTWENISNIKFYLKNQTSIFT